MTSFRSDEQNDVTEIPAHSQSLNIDYILEEDDLSGYNLYTLEYVQVTITITHSHRGDLEIRLECPSHTDSILGAPRELDEYVFIVPHSLCDDYAFYLTLSC